MNHVSTIHDGMMAPSYTISDARRDLERFAQSDHLARRGVAHGLSILSFDAIGTYEVSVESFTEARSVAWVHRALDEPLPESPKRGGTHSRWSVSVDPPPPFTTHETKVMVPRTVSVVTCTICDGRRRVPRCRECQGTGQRPCRACADLAAEDRARCEHCGGTGLRKCHAPHTEARQSCPTCHGTGSMHRYLELTVQWTNWVAVREVVQGPLPRAWRDAPPRSVSIYEEEDRRLYSRPPGPALMDGGTRVNEAVHEAVNELLGDADHLLGAARLLRQRISVNGVPVYHGRYEFNDGPQDFWILGRGEQVLAPSYPQSAGRLLGALGVVVMVLLVAIGAVGGWMYRDDIRNTLGWEAESAQ